MSDVQRRDGLVVVDMNDIKIEDVIAISDKAYKNGVADTLEDVNEMLADYGMSIDLKTRTCKVENKPVDEPKSTAWVNIPEAPDDAEIDDFRVVLVLIKSRLDLVELMVRKFERKCWGE